MALAEFDLIDRYFKQQTLRNTHTRVGIGDDCALLSVPDGYELAITTDTMVEEVHFIADTRPEWLGHKLLAVNLSDLASMGAEPIAVLLALTLPQVDEGWLQGFSSGFLGLAQRYGIDLIGGDTTSGPLTLTVQALGIVPKQRALRRSTAQVGDLICMTGLLGEAGLGLKLAQQHYSSSQGDAALTRFHRPEPQIASGLAIRDLAHACIDISDGLIADLGHITSQSNVGARVEWEKLPLSSAVVEYINATGDWQMPLCAGDDYELCFTISADNMPLLPISCTPIGVIEQAPGIRIYKHGISHTLTRQGYEHFSE